MAYAPTRFALDFLRAQDVRDADPRHLGLTPAQWLCFLLLGVGAYLYWKAMQGAERGDDQLLRAREIDASVVRGQGAEASGA
jgi:phosphatidylglycerol:prolipoprotein diacylglycerol transferase